MLRKIPDSYHQSYPRAVMDLQRAAFGSAWTDLARPYCSTASTVETIDFVSNFPHQNFDKADGGDSKKPVRI